MKILVINGPNLGLLGVREPEIYGRTTLKDIEDALLKAAAEYPDCELEFLQSNHEGVIIDRLNALLTDKPADGIVINPAAYTHTSVAILDALKATGLRTIEVHLTDPGTRENFRHISYVAPAAEATYKGFGFGSYAKAIRHLAGMED